MPIKLTFKNIAILVALIGLIILLFTRGCNDNPQVNTKLDTAILNDFINRKGIEFKKLMSDNKVLNDSIKTAQKTKIKIVYRTKTVYDSLLVTDTSCVKSLVTLYNECQNNDSINNVIIDNLTTQNANLVSATNNQQDVIDMQNYKIKQDSTEKVILQEQSDIEYKKGLRKGRRQGIGIGKVGEIIKDGLYLYLKK